MSAFIQCLLTNPLRGSARTLAQVSRRSLRRSRAALTGVALLLSLGCFADDATISSFWEKDFLLENAEGNRASRRTSGVTSKLNYFSTTMHNVSGGYSSEDAYKENIQFAVDVDADQLWGVQGGRVFFSAFAHRGDSLNASVGSSIGTRKDDVNASVHLFEFGYEQQLFDDALSIKFGQLAVTSDFFRSSSGFFIHDSFNWQPNGHSGAPAGPDSALGARVRWNVSQGVYLQAAVYDNSTSGNFGNDEHDKHGTKWHLPKGGKSVYFVEGGFVPGTAGEGQWPSLKLGAWRNQSPRSSAINSLDDSANWGIYAIAEHILWQNEASPQNNLRLFARVNKSAGDHNQFEWEFNTGLLLAGPLPGRDRDSAGIAFTQAEVSPEWRAATQSGSHERIVELKYKARIAGWMNVEPFVQYIIEPGAPSGRQLANALVLGLGSSIAF